MVEVVLTAEQSTQCSFQTLDLVAKSAMVGAAAYVLWNVFVKEGVVGRDLPTRLMKKVSGRLASRFNTGA
jgi:hypothetical protein